MNCLGSKAAHYIITVQKASYVLLNTIQYFTGWFVLILILVLCNECLLILPNI